MKRKDYTCGKCAHFRAGGWTGVCKLHKTRIFARDAACVEFIPVTKFEEVEGL